MAKTLFETMRPAVAQMHNVGNPKAIGYDFIDAFENISKGDVNVWAGKITRLQDVCYQYCTMRRKAENDPTITEETLDAKRNEVYEQWKSLISTNGKEPKNMTLTVTKRDIESLTEFSWQFMKTAAGTVEAGEKKQKFRQNVETLIGVKMARNECLTDADRKVLKSYQKAKSGIKAQNEHIKSADAEIAQYNLTLKGLKNEPTYKAFLEKLISDATERKEEAEKKLAEKKAQLAEVADKAAAIENNLKTIKVTVK